MARLRKFIRHPLIEELTDILRARFTEAKLTLHGFKVGKYECYQIDAKCSATDAADLMACLQMLPYTYGNVGFSFDGTAKKPRVKKPRTAAK